MFLKSRNNDNMIDMSRICDLTNLYHNKVLGCYQNSEELQDQQEFDKSDLVFLSGVELPKCWTAPNYRVHK